MNINKQKIIETLNNSVNRDLDRIINFLIFLIKKMIMYWYLRQNVFLSETNIFTIDYLKLE